MPRIDSLTYVFKTLYPEDYFDDGWAYHFEHEYVTPSNGKISNKIIFDTIQNKRYKAGQNEFICKYIHVLKFKEREEYLFGDSLIGAYQFIRGRLRQHETIYF